MKYISVHMGKIPKDKRDTFKKANESDEFVDLRVKDEGYEPITKMIIGMILMMH